APLREAEAIHGRAWRWCRERKSSCRSRNLANAPTAVIEKVRERRKGNVLATDRGPVGSHALIALRSSVSLPADGPRLPPLRDGDATGAVPVPAAVPAPGDATLVHRLRVGRRCAGVDDPASASEAGGGSG